MPELTNSNLVVTSRGTRATSDGLFGRSYRHAGESTGRLVSVSSDAGRYVVAGTVPTRCARAGPHSVPHRLSMIRRPREGGVADRSHVH